MHHGHVRHVNATLVEAFANDVCRHAIPIIANDARMLPGIATTSHGISAALVFDVNKPGTSRGSARVGLGSGLSTDSTPLRFSSIMILLGVVARLESRLWMLRAMLLTRLL